MLEKDYVEDMYLDICPLRVKKLFNYSEYNELITQFIPNISYGIRGLYFNTLNLKHCNQLFMYKNTKKNVIHNTYTVKSAQNHRNKNNITVYH